MGYPSQIPERGEVKREEKIRGEGIKTAGGWHLSRDAILEVRRGRGRIDWERLLTDRKKKWRSFSRTNKKRCRKEPPSSLRKQCFDSGEQRTGRP